MYNYISHDSSTTIRRWWLIFTPNELNNIKLDVFLIFYLGEEEVDVAYDYVYLGVTFNYNGTFTKAMEKQINQARKRCLLY